jgi:hypothetical protein
VERIERAIGRELSRSGGGAGAALHAITSAWPDAVGEEVARCAWPLRMGRDGTLHVATVSSTWAFELDRLAPEILDRLRAALGEEAPAKLRFAAGPVPEPPGRDAPDAEPTHPPEVAPEAAAEAAAAAAEIADPELRELALRAARASLSRHPSDRRF